MKESIKRLRELEQTAARRMEARINPDALTIGLHEIREQELMELAAELDRG